MLNSGFSFGSDSKYVMLQLFISKTSGIWNSAVSSSAYFDYKEDGAFPKPPSYNVATTLPSYDEAERTKAETTVPLVTGRVSFSLFLPAVTFMMNTHRHRHAHTHHVGRACAQTLPVLSGRQEVFSTLQWKGFFCFVFRTSLIWLCLSYITCSQLLLLVWTIGDS